MSGLQETKLVSDEQNEELNTEEIAVDKAYVLPADKRKRVQNLLGFWILGLCNNYGYVIMLSAAFDLLHEDYHDEGQQNSTNATESICNPISTGAILLADILPSLCIKLIAPFIAIQTHSRVLIAVTLSFMSFIITSLSVARWMTFLGVICAALSSGLGEVTFLSYSTFFDKDVVSTWSSGTGGAGVVGALSYASLTHVLTPRHTLQVMLIVPVLLAVTFWILIEHPPAMKCNCRGSLCSILCSSERKPILHDTIDLASKESIKNPKPYFIKEKFALIKPLLKYMIPLGLVYFAEYFINQGLMELLYFENASSWLSLKEQYRWYQVDYQVGVLISRSSVNLFRINWLWILPILQIINAVFLILQVMLPFIPSIWIVLGIIFYEGLLGGCAYVNTFYKISSEVSEDDREFSMGIASLADSIGIACAGFVSLPVHKALCERLTKSL